MKDTPSLAKILFLALASLTLLSSVTIAENLESFAASDPGPNSGSTSWQETIDYVQDLEHFAYQVTTAHGMCVYMFFNDWNKDLYICEDEEQPYSLISLYFTGPDRFEGSRDAALLEPFIQQNWSSLTDDQRIAMYIFLRYSVWEGIRLNATFEPFTESLRNTIFFNTELEYNQYWYGGGHASQSWPPLRGILRYLLNGGGKRGSTRARQPRVPISKIMMQNVNRCLGRAYSHIAECGFHGRLNRVPCRKPHLGCAARWESPDGRYAIEVHAPHPIRAGTTPADYPPSHTRVHVEVKTPCSKVKKKFSVDDNGDIEVDPEP